MLNFYIERLGLSWRVRCFIEQEEGFYCSIESFADLAEHRIYFSQLAAEMLAEGQIFTPLHELCHGSLAEKYHPLLSGKQWHPSVQQNSDFDTKAELLHVALQHLEVWVDDETSAVAPGVLADGIEGSLGGLVVLLPTEDQLLSLNSLYSYWKPATSLAEIYAAIVRNKLTHLRIQYEETVREVVGELGLLYGQTVRRLAGHFASVPRLDKIGKERVLKVFEKKTQQTSEILKLPIRPFLVEHEGKIVWMIERG